MVVDFVGQSHFNKNIDSSAVDGRMTLLSVITSIVIARPNELTLANCYFRY
jgi:hypothetical protein